MKKIDGEGKCIRDLLAVLELFDKTMEEIRKLNITTKSLLHRLLEERTKVLVLY